MIKLFRTSIVLIMVCIMCLIPAMSVFADAETEKEKKDIDISLSPKETLFDINNMKPGDWAPRSIKVINSGSKDFFYHMQMRNNGEVKLFNQLMLEIKTGDKQLYQGKLAEFKSLPARKLANESNESLDITVRFPEHLGNDFQGLKAEFVFIFTAEGSDSTAAQASANGKVDSGSGPTPAGFSLPDTSTNLFNLILFGAVLVAAGIVLIVVRYYRRIRTDK